MYTVLIIGAGNIAALYDDPKSKQVLTHAHAFFEHSGFNLKGFLDIQKEKAQEAASRWNCTAYQDWEVAMENVDIVCSCVPDIYHAEILQKIANYPIKLVVAEKPLIKNEEEAKAIWARYFGRIPLAVNYSRRYLKEYQDLKEEINQYGKFLKGIGYYGKGIVHNASHMIDLLIFLLDSIPIVESSSHVLQDFNSEDLSCDATLVLAGGFFYMVAVDARVATIFELELFFEKARIRILDGGMRIERYSIKQSPVYVGYHNYILDSAQNVDYSEAMRGLVKNIKDFLEHKQKLLCSMDDGITVLRTCLKIQEILK